MLAQLLRGDEPVPAMGADRQPAQHVFGADDGKHVGLERAIDGGEQHQSARAYQPGTSGKKGADVGHMLDHLETDDRVVTEPLLGQVLDASDAVVDREPLGGGVLARRLDIFLPRIETGDVGGEPCQGFRDQATPAAHIEETQAFQRPQAAGWPVEMAHKLIAQEGEPGRADLVQGPEFAARIPPLGRQRHKAVAFGWVEGVCRWLRKRWHDAYGAPAAGRVKRRVAQSWQTALACRPSFADRSPGKVAAAPAPSPWLPR